MRSSTCRPWAGGPGRAALRQERQPRRGPLDRRDLTRTHQGSAVQSEGIFVYDLADRGVEEWVDDNPIPNSLARLDRRGVCGIDGSLLCAEQNQNVTTDW